jgi:succinyl-diaminopimelate desuccinylase
MMEEIIQLTKALMQYRSMHSKPEQILACAEFISDYLNKIGISHRLINNEGIPSIIKTNEEGITPVLFMSHIDVVDAPEELFTPIEKEGAIYGRGSIDDKYAAALSLVLLRECIQECRSSGIDPQELPLGILITGDEEIGGMRGAKSILKEIKAGLCIALDGGSLSKIVVKEKGLLRLRLISRGRSAHGARPWLGENAIEKLMDDYSKIKEFFRETSSDHWHRTLNLSILHAGKSHNQVPDLAEALLDIRITEHDDPDELFLRMKDSIQGELIVESKGPVFMGGNSPYLKLLLDIVSDASLGFEHGASDARFLSEHGIPGIVWGANGDMSQHSIDEHVNIESISLLYSRLRLFLRSVSKKDVALS